MESRTEKDFPKPLIANLYRQHFTKKEEVVEFDVWVFVDRIRF